MNRGFLRHFEDSATKHMEVRPQIVRGTLRQEPNKTWIELESPVLAMENDTPLQLVIWDARPAGGRSELEEIARVQQLEIEIVATGIAAEGKLAERSESFRKRIEAAQE
jgi:hypothetical protein